MSRNNASLATDEIDRHPADGGEGGPQVAPPLQSTPSEPSPAAAPAAPIQQSPAMIAAYMIAATIIALTQGLGMSLISANLTQIAGPLGATTTEAAWWMAAYLAPNVSLSILLFKVRTQFGLRRFAEVAIVAYVAISIAHIWVDDFHSGLLLRFFAGVAAAPMSSIAFLYMLEHVPPHRKLNVGLCMALTALALSTPVAGLISPSLLDLGGWHALYLVETGLAMICLAAIYLLPLAPQPRANVISITDLVSFCFLAIGLGAFAIVLTVGRLYWWTAEPWLGWLLVTGIVATVVMALIELQRDTPLLDIRWLTSREIIHFAGALLLFRLLLSEQSAGAVRFFNTLGLQNEQMVGFYWIVLLSAVVSGLVCAAIMKPGREGPIHIVALLLLAVGSYMDSHVTILTRPEEMYLSQFLVGMASGLFLPPALAVGLMSAMKRGPNYILSFIVVFLATQKVGGALGSAIFGTFVTIREQFHSNNIVLHLVPSDPLVAIRLQQLGSAYSRVLTDAAQRSAQGAALLAKQATQQANVLAYADAFLATAVISMVALVILLAHLTWRHLTQIPIPIPAAAAPAAA